MYAIRSYYDVGEVAQIGTLNVPISSAEDMESVLKESKTQVLIDFTIADATAVNAPRARNNFV